MFLSGCSSSAVRTSRDLCFEEVGILSVPQSPNLSRGFSWYASLVKWVVLQIQIFDKEKKNPPLSLGFLNGFCPNPSYGFSWHACSVQWVVCKSKFLIKNPIWGGNSFEREVL